ncbi:O-methyltransferase-domain-containing protein, partial [Mycena crocata]
IQLPEQEYIRHRFGISMVGMASMLPATGILDAFLWKSLAPDAIIVDVGGSLATSAIAIAMSVPPVKTIVQDLPGVVKHIDHLYPLATSKTRPELLASGRIELQEHDFFTHQPVTNASVFLLKQILHNWSNQYCAKILKI